MTSKTTAQIGREANKELSHTHAAFEAIKTEVYEELKAVKSPEHAFECAMTLRAIDTVRGKLNAKVENAKLEKHFEDQSKQS